MPRMLFVSVHLYDCMLLYVLNCQATLLYLCHLILLCLFSFCLFGWSAFFVRKMLFCTPSTKSDHHHSSSNFKAIYPVYVGTRVRVSKSDEGIFIPAYL